MSIFFSDYKITIHKNDNTYIILISDKEQGSIVPVGLELKDDVREERVVHAVLVSDSVPTPIKEVNIGSWWLGRPEQ